MIYPNHSLVITSQPVLKHPAVLSSPLPDSPLVTITRAGLFARIDGVVSGTLVDSIEFGAFVAAWDNHDFIVYSLSWVLSPITYFMHFILHEGPKDPARALVLAAGIYDQELHEQIWVFNQGFWNKDHQLWVDVQSADWKDVILTDEFKTALQKDVYGFFKSEAIYKELAIPWKRGLILWGPPGNGKTISIKVVMKTCDALGFAPLYVKSFQSWQGEEASMQSVFSKARQFAPCVIVLEDLDALINDRNRSFFLNQLDGLQGNDGLLVIGTTNHFERLDPGLSSRPSRFDRKYLFDDPDRDARVLYIKYWQDKLESNDEIDFPDALVEEAADMTAHFSFAYLKEAFVSCLVTLAGWEGKDKPAFPDALKKQIKTLRKQLDKNPRGDAEKRDFRPLFDMLSAAPVPVPTRAVSSPAVSQLPSSTGERNIRALLDRIASENSSNVDSLFDALSAAAIPSRAVSPPALSQSLAHNAGERNIRALLDRLASENSSNVDSLTQQLDAWLKLSGQQTQSMAPSAWDSPHTQYHEGS